MQQQEVQLKQQQAQVQQQQIQVQQEWVQVQLKSQSQEYSKAMQAQTDAQAQVVPQDHLQQLQQSGGGVFLIHSRMSSGAMDIANYSGRGNASGHVRIYI